MVKLLLWKMIREMRRSAGAYGVCILIIAIGFCGYAVLAIAADQLIAAGEQFYRLTDFPDAFAQVESAPLSAAAKLMEIQGVTRAEGRLKATVRTAGLAEAAGMIQDPELMLVSLGADYLARPLLSRGQLPGAGQRELAVGDAFLDAHRLSPGDNLSLIWNGRPVSFTISGSGISPENIYLIKTINDMLPDPQGYDAGFISYETMSRFLGKPGLANEFLLFLQPGADWAGVKAQVEEVLSPYGCYQVYPRKDQMSVAMLEMELEQLQRMAKVVPGLFLVVAAVILYISLSRMIQQQRIQIGTLLALGLSPRQVQRHYLAYGACTGFIGGLAGSALGYLCARPMVEFYRLYFSLPDIWVPISMQYLVQGLVVATAFCGLIGWLTARSLGRLQPAETLRPAAPKAARQLFLERIPYGLSLFTVPGIMALRSIARNRRRAFLSLGGIALAYMITATLVSMYSLFDVFLFDYLEVTQRQDISVEFTQPLAAEAAMAALTHPSIAHREGVLTFAATLRGPGGEEAGIMQAIDEDSRLCLLFDPADRPVHVQAEGVVLSQHLAKLLGVRRGDQIVVEVEYPRKKTSLVTVTEVIAQYMGSTAYLSHHQAARISDYGNAYTSILIQGDQGAAAELADTLLAAPQIASILSRQEKVAMYRGMMGNMNGIMASMALLGVVIGLAVIYVSSLISFEELKREIAVMITLGLKSKQCLDVIAVGQWLLAIMGIALGIPLTIMASRWISSTIATDMFTIPSFVDGSSLALSVFLTFAAVWLSSLLMLRKIRALAPVDLLRERE